MKNITPFTLIDLAKQAGSVEELVELAEENKIGLSEEDAKIYYDRWHDCCELSDDELEAVGGGYEEYAAEKIVCELCGSDNLVLDLSEGGYRCMACKRRCRGRRA